MAILNNPEDYIENQIIPTTPCDNENELLTCLFATIILSIFYLIYYK